MWPSGVRRDVFGARFNHAVLTLADREIPRVWAGIEIPGLPTLSEHVRLIAERVRSLVAARAIGGAADLSAVPIDRAGVEYSGAQTQPSYPYANMRTCASKTTSKLFASSVRR